jgi:hypothetical protein
MEKVFPGNGGVTQQMETEIINVLVAARYGFVEHAQP